MTVRILIADDQELIRTGFRMILNAEPALEVVGEAVDGTEAVAAARDLQPDVVLMDIRMPGLDGIEATRRILAAGLEPAPKVVILTTFDLDEYVYDARGRERLSAQGRPCAAAGQRGCDDRRRRHAARADDHAPADRAVHRAEARPSSSPRPRRADPARARGLQAARDRDEQCRDRRTARRRRDDHQDARRADPDEARPSRPSACSPRRLRRRNRAGGHGLPDQLAGVADTERVACVDGHR